jgi:hypothetical protein
MEEQVKYITKKSAKKMGRHEVEHARVGRLTVRWSDLDAERLARVQALLSPRVAISQGKAMSAALELAEKALQARPE